MNNQAIAQKLSEYADYLEARRVEHPPRPRVPAGRADDPRTGTAGG